MDPTWYQKRSHQLDSCLFSPVRFIHVGPSPKGKWKLCPKTLSSSVLFVLLFIGVPSRNYTTMSQKLFFDSSATETNRSMDDVSLWLDKLSHSVVPLMCHSHNDYWRPYPLFSALAAGCTGIEADVWLSDDGKDLLVGHDRGSLSPNKTFQSMYLEPLLDILDYRNPDETWVNNTVYDRARGVFEMQPDTSVVLMIDVKEKPMAVRPLVLQQLEPLRQKRFLTRYEVVFPEAGFVERQTLWPGPHVVVGSGDNEPHLAQSSLSQRHVSPLP